MHAESLSRENFASFPTLPVLRNDYVYEEFAFVPALLRCYRPSEYDITLTCGYPFTNWVLRRPKWRGSRPPHVFVTQNGDWPAYARNSEYRLFGCDGLVCTNLDFYERNKTRWRCRTIPNGIDFERFHLGIPRRHEFNLPEDRLIVLMVSALIPTKRVEMGVEVVSRIPDAHLVVAGDGPLRPAVDAIAAHFLPGRFTRLSLAPEQMPALYQSADIFLHLSKEEPFGNVFVEAMACGLPIVAHNSASVTMDCGGMRVSCRYGRPGRDLAEYYACASCVCRPATGAGDEGVGVLVVKDREHVSGVFAGSGSTSINWNAGTVARII